MYASINQAQILGNVVREPEVRFTTSGLAVMKLTVATNHSKKVGDAYEDYAVYHNVTLMGNLADKSNGKIQKGSKLFVRGMIKNDSWQDDAGNWKNRSEIITSDFRDISILDGRGGGSGAPSSGGASNSQGAPKQDAPSSDNQSSDNSDFDDDLPF